MPPAYQDRHQDNPWAQEEGLPRRMPDLIPLPGTTPAEKSFLHRLLDLVAWLPVAFCISLIAWSYYAFVFSLSLSYLFPRRPWMAIAYLLLHHAILGVYMWSYAGCVLQDAGSVLTPDTGVSQGSRDLEPLLEATSSGPPVGEDPENYENITVKDDGRARWCRKCRASKPDRAHHCRICRRCVLKMDHHCPWINNCVGFANQKAFLLFVLWGAVYCTWCACAVLPPLYSVLNTDPELELVDVGWIFLVLAGGVFGICFWGFAAFHVHMILSNRTTIEGFQRHRYRQDLSTASKNVFDMGWRNNWCSVMGLSPWLWFLPVKNTPGDGRTFRTTLPTAEGIV